MTPKDIAYNGSESREYVVMAMQRISKNYPKYYVYFNSCFHEAWFSFTKRLDKYACGTQSGKWIGGYCKNGQFKPFSQKNIIWEQKQGLLCE